MKSDITILALAGLFVALGAAQAKDQDKCSTRTTTGKYVVVCDGFLTPAPNAPLVPAKNWRYPWEIVAGPSLELEQSA